MRRTPGAFSLAIVIDPEPPPRAALWITATTGPVSKPE
jgi:hypothetical protein